MLDREDWFIGYPRCNEQTISLVQLLHFVEEGFICTSYSTTIIQHTKYSLTRLLQECNDFLVISELYLMDILLEVLKYVGSLFLLENIQDVQLKELLIRVVDEHLLEGVGGEHLESIDIQQTNIPESIIDILWGDSLIQFHNQPIEKLLIDLPSEGLYAIDTLYTVVWWINHILTHLSCFGCSDTLKLLHI